jgi:homoserine/homoserine lactone efflux protein
MTFKLWLVFAATEFLLSMTPGPGVLLIISQGMKFGGRASIKGTLGIQTANTLYFILSAAGLGALLLASAQLFQIIKWIGVGYLIFLGIKMLLSKGELSERLEQASSRKISRKLFSQGLITQLANPKAIVFFTALLPQFIAPGENVLLQFFILSMTAIVVEFPVLAIYGWVAERGRRLIPKGRFAALPDRIAGMFLIGTGIGLAAIRKP